MFSDYYEEKNLLKFIAADLQPGWLRLFGVYCDGGMLYVDASCGAPSPCCFRGGLSPENLQEYYEEDPERFPDYE